jgi:hypothetical protein
VAPEAIKDDPSGAFGRARGTCRMKRRSIALWVANCEAREGRCRATLDASRYEPQAGCTHEQADMKALVKALGCVFGCLFSQRSLWKR